jgi:lysophospholipase L1-like esterase
MAKPFSTLFATVALTAQMAWSQPAAVPAASNSASTNTLNAPTAVAITARPNGAIIPGLNRGFMRQHTNNVEVAKKGDIDLLFMGDSITDWWRSRGKAVFDQHFGAMKVANFGIAGDTTQGVLWRLQNGEGEGFKPKAIMLMIGTNNGNTAPEVAMGVAAVVFELRKDFPDAKILLLAIFPRDTANSRSRLKNTEANKIIAALHDNQHVFFMDIGPQFLAEDGSIPKDIMADGLHPTNKGYEIWAQAVQDKLATLMQ